MIYVNEMIERIAISSGVNDLLYGQYQPKTYLNESLKIGIRVVIIAPKNEPIPNLIKPFVGVTGKIQNLEDKKNKLWRVVFDNPVIINGLKINSDFFQSKYLKELI